MSSTWSARHYRCRGFIPVLGLYWRGARQRLASRAPTGRAPGSGPPFAAGLGSPGPPQLAPCPPAACSPLPRWHGCLGREGCRPATRAEEGTPWERRGPASCACVGASTSPSMHCALQEGPGPPARPPAWPAHFEARRKRAQQLDSYAQPDQRGHAAVLHRRRELHLQDSRTDRAVMCAPWALRAQQPARGQARARTLEVSVLQRHGGRDANKGGTPACRP